MGFNEKGESVALWAPFQQRDEAISYLRFAQASLALKIRLRLAAKHFHKITQQPASSKASRALREPRRGLLCSPEYIKLINDTGRWSRRPDAAGSARRVDSGESDPEPTASLTPTRAPSRLPAPTRNMPRRRRIHEASDGSSTSSATTRRQGAHRDDRGVPPRRCRRSSLPAMPTPTPPHQARVTAR